MPRGTPIEIMGILLQHEGVHIVVYVETEDGKTVEVIREHAEGPIGHNVTEHGIRSRIDRSY